MGLRLIRATRSARPATIPAWGPPRSLSPLNVTRSAPAARVSRGVGSRGSPQRVRSTREPLPRSTTKGRPRARASLGEVPFGDLGGEPPDDVVAGMHLHDQGGLRADRGGVVVEVRPVRRADLAQPASRAGHDVGHAERAADLDQLAAGDRHLLAERQGIEGQQDGGGVVVDGGRGLGARERAQARLEVAVPVAAPPAVEVEFEVRGPQRRPDRGLSGLGRQGRASQVRMEHRAGEVEDGSQAGRGGGLQFRSDGAGEVGGRARRQPRAAVRRQGGAQVGQDLPHRVRGGGLPVGVRERRDRRLPEHPVHGRNRGQVRWFRCRHGPREGSRRAVATLSV